MITMHDHNLERLHYTYETIQIFYTQA